MTKRRATYDYWVTDVKSTRVLPHRFDIDSISGAKSILKEKGKVGRQYDIVRQNINKPYGTRVGTYKVSRGKIVKVERSK